MEHIPDRPTEDLACRPDLLHWQEPGEATSDPALDHITRLAATSLDIPIAIVALSDGDRQWFISAMGVDFREVPSSLSFCLHADATEPLTEIADASLDPRFTDNPYVTGAEHIRFYAGVTLRSPAGASLGTLCVLDRVPRHLDTRGRQILMDLAALAAHELEIRRIAATDPLTGAWNRRMLEQVAHNEFRRAQRLRQPFSLALMDLDHFKAVNDRHGHAAGNDALCAFADTFRGVMRTEDWLFRVGGEEFIAILTGCTGATGLIAIDRLRAALERRDVEGPGGRFNITLSGAVIEAACPAGKAHDSLDGLLRQADLGLYAAKRNGRNCIMPVEPRQRQRTPA